jgi:NAD(P)-dependent dehydrogenase (short-subunit alcohol dehydrogenase family)
MQQELKQSILVTGASSGIGRATVDYLAANGFGVYAGVRKVADQEDLRKIARVTPLLLDVTKQDSVEAAVKEITKAGTGLYGVVNNAGITLAGPLLSFSDAEMMEQFQVNIFGIHRVTRACFPLLLQSKGRIVMISSDSGFYATPFFGPYCASKFAVEGYSDSLRREMQLLDIKVILIEPGEINTPIWDKGQAMIERMKKSMDFPLSDLGLKLGNYAIEKGKSRGLPPVEVAKGVFHALTAEKPKVRYLICAKPFKYWMIRHLKAEKVDAMIKKALLEA